MFSLLLSNLKALSSESLNYGFDLVSSFVVLAKLFVLKKSWHTAADFAIASLTLAFYKQPLRPELPQFESNEHTVHPGVLQFLSDHSCLVHILVMTDRSAEILPFLPKLERIVKFSLLYVHHADSVPPVVVFHVAASEVYRAANMPSRSAAAMKDAIDLLQADPGIQRRLAHAPTSHIGNLSFDPRLMARLMQSQTVLAARMKQRDEKEGRLTDPLPYRPPRIPLPVPEFELPAYPAGSSYVSCSLIFCLSNLSLLRLSAKARPLRPLLRHDAQFEEVRPWRQGVHGSLGLACQGSQSLCDTGCLRWSRHCCFVSVVHVTNVG